MSENVISSNELSNYISLIEKNTNNFSFTREAVNAVNNFNFKKTAYDTLSGNSNTKDSYIWNALSNIAEKSLSDSFLHENISEVFESNILNFIDNISDIDTCKIKSLQSMISQLGINYTVFDKIKLMPLKILKLIDVLSIKKEYLLNGNKVQPLFAQLLGEQISSLNTETSVDLMSNIEKLTNARLTSVFNTTDESIILSTELGKDNISVKYKPYINSNLLYNFTSAVYNKVLSDYCHLKYNWSDLEIYRDLSDTIILSDFTITNTDIDEIDKLEKYRLKYNVSKSFNQVVEYDKIENGYTKFSDYSIHEQYLLSAEQAYRNQPLSANELQSRYYYYRQKAVQEYFKFVENEYSNYLSLYIDSQKYNVDNSYLIVKNTSQRLYTKNSDDYNINQQMIEHVAQLLAQITDSIREIREQIKTQVQKNFLKGTKLHLSYVVREYVKNNIYPVYKKICQQLNATDQIHEYQVSDVIINVNEYVDPTEYFNISTANDAENENVNARFWESSKYINQSLPHNSNNIFSNSNFIKGSSKTEFTFDNIYSMYSQNLQMQLEPIKSTLSLSKYDDKQKTTLNNFLNNVYNTGADNTFKSSNGNICCNIDLNLTNSISNYNQSKLSSFRDYKNRLFKKYSGLSSGSESFYNLKNKKHPSYQIHPYLQAFMYSDEFDYPIDNIANIISEKFSDILYNKLSTYIDQNGYLKNVWNNPYNVNSDYISIYEKSSNKTPLNVTVEHIDYDGIFYPTTIYEFLKNSNEFKISLNNQTNKWYNKLNLSQTELSQITSQLTNLSSYLSAVANNPYYNIYRYGRDYFNNMYILVKYDNSIRNIKNAKHLDSDYWKDKPGIMFMRIKNHPIAFPMMVYDTSNNYKNDISQIKYINNKHLALKSNTAFDNVNMISNFGNNLNSFKFPAVYDFTISKDKSELMFVCKYTENSNNETQVIHANIKKIFDSSLEQNKYNYYLTQDIQSGYSDSTQYIPLFDYTFEGFYNNNTNLGVVATKLNNNRYTIYMPYWIKNEKYGDQVKNYLRYDLTCNDLSVNTKIHINVTDKKNITVAYINNKLTNNNLNLKDRLGHIFSNYPQIKSNNQSINDKIDTINRSITTRELVYDSKQIKPLSNIDRKYVLYGNMGFVKTFRDKDNNIYQTNDNNNGSCWQKNLIQKQQVKFELIGKPSATSNKGIFFKFAIPARMHESYSTKQYNEIFDSSDTKANSYRVGNYTDARYSEMKKRLQTISRYIYDPTQFQTELGTTDISIRIDEQFDVDLNDITNKTDGEFSKKTFDKFKDNAYLIKATNIRNIHELYDPGTYRSQYQANTSNQYIIGLYNNNGTEDVLSVCWYNTTKGIKLDFNTKWYNYHTEHDFKQDSSLKNLYNIKHQFLNLDSPGNSGYLQLQKIVNNALIPSHIFFIKNISDTTPKFILQLVDDKINDDFHDSVQASIDKYYVKSDKYKDIETQIEKNNDYIKIGDSKLYVTSYFNQIH